MLLAAHAAAFSSIFKLYILYGVPDAVILKERGKIIKKIHVEGRLINWYGLKCCISII